ncbi:hypothetical protein KKE60_06690 [Patescibacteria group bacterium]|nr:hypothetical protein [Patescibacteria group bacterium]
MDFNVLLGKDDVKKNFDISTVKGSLSVYDQRFMAMEFDARVCTIESEKDHELAVEMAIQAKKLVKKINNIRDKFISEPKEYVRSVNNMAKSYTDRLAAIEKCLRDKLSNFQYQRELERRKAEEEARKAAAEIQTRLNEEAKAANVEPVQIIVPLAPQPKIVTRTAEGSSSSREVWTFAVDDESKIPPKYFVLDTKRIGKDVRSGIRDIPGVRIYQEFKTVLRG